MYYDNLRRRVMRQKLGTAAQSAAAATILDNIAPSYMPLHEDITKGLHSTFILPGGRGSGKSSFISLELVAGMMADPTASAIVLRRTFATMRDSVFSQIQWAVDTLGVSALWRSSVSPLVLYVLANRTTDYFPRFGRCFKTEINKTPERDFPLCLG